MGSMDYIESLIDINPWDKIGKEELEPKFYSNTK
jgi:hypothetical protein